jgi:hypothetical protein
MNIYSMHNQEYRYPVSIVAKILAGVGVGLFIWSAYQACL